MKTKILPLIVMLSLGCSKGQAQINSGSNGSDGALDFGTPFYVTNIVIDMHDHPNGIYQYTYINIQYGETITFIPNANNSPVIWLVQSNVVINGTLDLSGQPYNGSEGGVGGPGGYRGGGGGPPASAGQGPGGGPACVGGQQGGNASFGSLGSTNYGGVSPGQTYGNVYLMPLVGGSGGGGTPPGFTGSAMGGGGGGGAMLIAANGTTTLNGTITSRPGYGCGGSGSGGAIRFVATRIAGQGAISVVQSTVCNSAYGGSGRVRFDALENDFGISISGNFTQGFQPIIFPTTGQGAELTVTSVGGVPVSASPTGQILTPDAILSAQQNNPIPIVVNCANLPVHSLITVSVRPASGSPVSATGYNDTGTQASSTATISITLPRGGGIIYAMATTTN